ncbi:hypothetical protein LAA29_100159 [Leuconostoc carnosum]|uniref:bifunctional glycosyltransferase/CDP-glycerol:glycerophosphate glycerophosphotransferase n=1 Tax=Leuconostoc carnosum TaxID=1252 RepID=UPI000D511BA1|nr:bifunctional glycosyltransferase family 2 protein/CDP-glycerol:glycerophosphate glycerophosphotransferase [Leuconostoc carnosum]KAA8326107.1 bifunctional glycosyltransferase family 2 protein/CDP-glycerol:glycerophosphate glycerophosphotransferase [Leuconostoc carnosum]KAA8375906.1 bifunctional glycosyltransferase family 2 protein/CDP-glycerol:glycerophosphate glycerophosphotransferase [Leuconostoc carnosum]KAA8378569.1 bifunctional glycosyltransferase family 2 protein/CDP-glycerol:glycerophos
MDIKLSIIIPFYNVSDYLAEAIDSVLAQKGFTSEIILIDDGSTDGSHDIAVKYANEFSKIRLIVQENKGLGAARNVGVSHATGEYIVFHDSDDLVIENVYSQMLSQIDTSQSDFIVGNVARINNGGIWYSGLHKHAFPNTVSGVTIFSNNELINDTTAWNKIIRRSFWEQHQAKFPEGVLYEDIPIILPIYIHATVDVYSNLMYLWRSRPAGDASITQSHDYDNIHDRMLAVNHVYNVFQQDAPSLITTYNEKILTNDFQIYLREFYKQDEELFDYVYLQVQEYLNHVSIETLETLSLNLRIQYYLIKSDKKEELLTYLYQYRSGEVVNVLVKFKNQSVIMNSWSKILPEELKFVNADIDFSAKVNHVHFEDNSYVVNFSQKLPYLFTSVPSFTPVSSVANNTMVLNKRHSIFKMFLIEVFAAEEISKLKINGVKTFPFKNLIGQVLRKLLGLKRFQKMRLQTRKPSLPYELRIPLSKDLIGNVELVSETEKHIYLNVNSERPAIRTMPVENPISIGTGVDAEWQFVFKKQSNNDFELIYDRRNAINVEAIIVSDGFDIIFLENENTDYELVLVNTTDTNIIHMNDDHKYHIGGEYNEKYYQIFTRKSQTDELLPIKLVKTKNHSYEQTLALKDRVIQLQERQLATTLVFKQWEPLNWYEGTRLRRQTYKGIIYPLLRKLPLKNVMVYGSFWGKNFSDNPRAIYQFVTENKLSYKQVVVLQHNLGQYADLDNVDFVKPGSFRYYAYLARARYLFNNVNFDDDYIKRNDQIEVQTMHGTPLKKLGLDSPGEIMPSAVDKYVAKNRRWDYLTVPSDYVAEISHSAFQHNATILPIGYARNDELFIKNTDEYKEKIKKNMALPSNKRVVLYAPTWRVRGEFIPQIDFDALREQITEDTVLILKLHQFMSTANIPDNLKDFVKIVSDEIEISDLYLIADVLITDYSSVMFDYAVLKKPMIFYVYDYEKYSETMRPLYFDFKEEAPGKLAYTQIELVDALNHINDYENDYSDKISAFRKKFIQYDDGNSRQKLLETIGALKK